MSKLIKKNFLTQRQEIQDLFCFLFDDVVDEDRLKLLTGLDLLSLNKSKKAIEEDIKFIYDNDPSATSIDEVRVYSCVFAIAAYRIAHIIPCPLLSRSICEYAKSVTGVDIHPKAKIGVPFAIDHGVGVVVGQTAVIGKNSMLYHGVTLGAKHLKERNQVGQDRHPKLGDNCVVYSNTTILGNLKIPNGLIIGANKFILKQEEIDEIYKKQSSK